MSVTSIVPVMWHTEISAWGRSMRASGRSAGTIEQRRRYVARLAGTVQVGPWQVDDTHLVAWLEEPAWAPNTRRAAYGAVRAFYAWATLTGRTDHDPTRLVPRPRAPRGIPRPAREDDVAEGIRRATPRVRLILMLAALGGLRRAEIAGLHTRDLTRGGIRVTGKGGHTRLVAWSEQLRVAVDAYRPPTGWLFPSPVGGHLTPAHVGVLARRVLPDGVRLHHLRHLFATNVYSGERDLLALKEQLGHSSVATTQVYTRVDTSRVAAVVAQLRIDVA